MFEKKRNFAACAREVPPPRSRRKTLLIIISLLSTFMRTTRYDNRKIIDGAREILRGHLTPPYGTGSYVTVVARPTVNSISRALTVRQNASIVDKYDRNARVSVAHDLRKSTVRTLRETGEPRITATRTRVAIGADETSRRTFMIFIMFSTLIFVLVYSANRHGLVSCKRRTTTVFLRVIFFI